MAVSDATISKKLKENNIIQSMSRKGNCLDNSVIENFFGVLKSEFFYREKFRSIEIFQSKLNEYIRWYNNKRIKLKVKWTISSRISETVH